MNTRLKLTSIFTLVLGVQLIAPGIAGAATKLNLSDRHSTGATDAITLAAIQPDTTLSAKPNRSFKPKGGRPQGGTVGGGSR